MKSDLREDLLPVVVLASLLGGLTGAVVLLHTRQITFLHLIPWLLLIGAVIFGISGPVSRWLRARSAEPHAERTPRYLPLFCALLPICFYIGYFGAGGGFLMMTVLALFGVEEMHALNAMKIVTACLSNLVAIVNIYRQGSGAVALLPDLDGLCRHGRICGRTLCAAHESRGAADDRRDYRMCHFRLFLLEAVARCGRIPSTLSATLRQRARRCLFCRSWSGCCGCARRERSRWECF